MELLPIPDNNNFCNLDKWDYTVNNDYRHFQFISYLMTCEDQISLNLFIYQYHSHNYTMIMIMIMITFIGKMHKSYTVVIISNCFSKIILILKLI